MKNIFNATKFQKTLVGLSFVALGSAVFITNNSVQANEPIIKEVEASKKSFFGKREFFVSVLHDDTGFEHYADGFEILSVSGEVIAKRVLAHPHVDEQPVTRDIRAVSIPDGITEIDVRAHDNVHGYGPKVRVPIPAKDETIQFKVQNIKPIESVGSLEIEEFVQIKGLLHGIVFDDKGYMFVGRNGKEILKISPDGSVSLFTEIKEAEGYFKEGPGQTFLYDMEFDSRGQLYAAVEDRILKISEDGKYTALVEKKFPGIWGACGIALDQKDNIFYAYDNKIMKLTPEGINEIFLDGGQISPTLKAIVGIEFAPDYSHLFACDGKLGSGKLIKIPIRSDGSPGQVELLYHDENLNTEYIAFDKDSNLIIKGPWSETFIRVDKNGKAEPLKHADIGYGIQTITRGGQGFDQNAIYGTNMPWGVIYKIVLP